MTRPLGERYAGAIAQFSSPRSKQGSLTIRNLLQCNIVLLMSIEFDLILFYCGVLTRVLISEV